MKEEKEIRFRAEVDIEKIVSFLSEKYGSPEVLWVKDVYFDTEDHALIRNERGYRFRKVIGSIIREESEYKEIRGGKVWEKTYTNLGDLLAEAMEEWEIATAIIIELHEGRIWAESEGVGEGSSFFIEIPV